MAFKKYNWIIFIITLIIINYLLMTVTDGFNITEWDIMTKLTFQSYSMFDLFIGFFYYLSKKL